MTTMALSDLIAAAQTGRAEAFDELIDLYSRRLYGYFYRLCGQSFDAEDLLQELFIRLVKAIREYQHQDHFDAFLFRIATNLYRDWLRRRRRSKETRIENFADDTEDSESESFRPDPRSSMPDERLILSESRDRLQTALFSLPAAEREVILLRHFSDLTFQEIAVAMGTPLGTALARAHRGLSKLREMIEGPYHEQR